MGDDKKKIVQTVNNSFWFEKAIANSAHSYVSGEVVGALGQLNVRGSGGGGTDRVITIIADEAKTLALRIWFFRRGSLTTFTDTDTFLPSRNDFIKSAGYVDIAAADYQTYGTRTFAQARTANVDFSCPDGILYYYVEARSSVTMAAANKLFINFGHWPD